jgi:hypothetical protein
MYAKKYLHGWGMEVYYLHGPWLAGATEIELEGHQYLVHGGQPIFPTASASSATLSLRNMT